MKSLLIIVLLIFASKNANACTCHEFESQQELIEATDYVVQGTVVSKSQLTYFDTTKVDPSDTIALLFANEDGLKIRSEKVIEIKVKVKSVFKGQITSDTITIYTSPNSISCGDLRFKENNEYIILGYDRNYPEVIPNQQNAFWTSLCSGNSLSSEMRTQQLNEYFGK